MDTGISTKMNETSTPKEYRTKTCFVGNRVSLRNYTHAYTCLNPLVRVQIEGCSCKYFISAVKFSNSFSFFEQSAADFSFDSIDTFSKMAMTNSKQEDIDVRKCGIGGFQKCMNFVCFFFQVRFVDQEKINEFGKMNNRLLELRADLKQHKLDAEKMDDASAELMMSNGDGKVMLLIGESFIEVSEDYGNECELLVHFICISSLKLIHFCFSAPCRLRK